MSDAKDRDIVVARVLDAFGVKGQLKVRSFTEDPQNILEFTTWKLSRPGCAERVLEVVAQKLQNQYVIATLKGLASREEAIELKGFNISIPFSVLPTLSTGEYYWIDLIGLSVRNIDGSEFGVVEEMMETGANDVLMVRGNKLHLIPYVSTVIKDVDLDLGLILVDWFEDF